ncbi:hypothetical protein [uncultured Clostridium sp.]|uniref:hypothetical protein n=1 Tax=uncultured Clostridium sp. TaxID=59620 RepID=UPI0028EC713D|nr:hypothetical protein [uncultured Clostridium sp.]
MKSMNNVALEKRRNAMMFSERISQNNNIFKAPLEVKIKRGKLGSTCGAIFILISGILYIMNVSNLASGLFVAGVLTLGVNLIMLNYFNKK